MIFENNQNPVPNNVNERPGKACDSCFYSYFYIRNKLCEKKWCSGFFYSGDREVLMFSTLIPERLKYPNDGTVLNFPYRQWPIETKIGIR